MNRKYRRLLARKTKHLSHVCRDGAHVLHAAGSGYLATSLPNRIEFAQGELARVSAQRFHQECASGYAEMIAAKFGLDLSVRHEDEAESEGWR